jgi:SAM-dependent methyltransferase
MIPRHSFPTAPRWYRPLLHAEALLLPVVYPLLRRAADAKATPAPLSNADVNILGNPIPERAMPGAVPGWVLAQHLSRYAWALAACADRRVVELGSGSGLGAAVLASSGLSVVGVEIDAEAVAAATRAYPTVTFRIGDITEGSALPPGDIAVCFEVLEHVADPDAALAAALDRYARLLVSFPNPIFHGSHLNPHHRVDWPLAELTRRLRRHGAREIRTHHQNRRDAAVRSRAYPWSSIWILDVTTA